MEETAPRIPNRKTLGEFASNYTYRNNFFNSLICFPKTQIIAGRVHTTLHLF